MFVPRFTTEVSLSVSSLSKAVQKNDTGNTLLYGVCKQSTMAESGLVSQHQPNQELYKMDSHNHSL